ncbi:MAG: NUDIX hydrolase [Micrococcales bacterium]|nr:NUDIX hydrolase [Micrococcales bacterium]
MRPGLGEDLSPIHAAGCLVWRIRSGRLEVLLVHRPRYRDWSWPKGKPKDGESSVACALREVEEETGERVILGVRLPTLEYRLNTGQIKVVSYWAARPAGPGEAAALAVRSPVAPALEEEVDAVRWVRAGRARRMLTHLKDRVPLDELVARFRAGTLATRAVVVLRHAEAVPRSSWGSEQETRPLTEEGRARARGLTCVLSAFGVVALRTSPWRRCRATLKAYARAAALDRVEAPELTEDAALGRPAAAAAVVRRELRSSGPGSVVCTHRPVLPILFEALASACMQSQVLRGAIPQADPYLKTSEALVAHVAQRGPWRGRVVALERHRP